MNRKKISVFALMVVALTMVIATTVYARHLNFRWQSTTVPMRNFSFNAVWQPAMQAGITNWNTRNTRVTFVTNATSNNMITAGQFNDTWFGLASMQVSGSSINRFTIYMNSRTIANSATNPSNFITSVFAHELGHIIGLDDNPVAAQNGSIMNHARNRNTLTVPTAFDVESVNMLYR